MAKKETKKRAPTLTAEEIGIQEQIDSLSKKNDEQSKAAVKELRAKARRLAFQRLAPKRVRKALAALGNIEQLGGYPCEEGEAVKIVAALRDGVEKVADALNKTQRRKGADFQL